MSGGLDRGTRPASIGASGRTLLAPTRSYAAGMSRLDTPHPRAPTGARRHTYAFSSTWVVEAPVTHVFDVLADLERYPRWWPQVRRVERIADDAASVTVRSFLPYELTFVLTRTAIEVGAALEASMTGDLVGWSRWDLAPSERGTTVHFRERARVARRSLRWIEPFARPAFLANHAWMMRGCRTGVAAVVAGFDGARRRAT